MMTLSTKSIAMRRLKRTRRNSRSKYRRSALQLQCLEKRYLLTGTALNLPASSAGISFTEVQFNQFGDATVQASLSSGTEKDGYLVFGKPVEGSKTIRADDDGSSLDLEMGRYVQGALAESDDDTNGLNPEFTYDTAIDQQQLLDDGVTLVGGDVFQAQTFMPARRGELVRVDIGFSKLGANSADVTLEIQSTSGGVPSGSVLDSLTIAGDDVPVAATQTLTFDLSASPAYLEAGTLYAWVLKAPESTDGQYGVRFSNENSYGSGTAPQSTDGGSTWGITSNDNVFQTFVHETEHLIAVGERQENNSGNYTLTVDHPDQESQQTLLFNEGATIPAQGVIGSFRDYRFFEFVAPRDGNYEITVTPLAGFDAPTFLFDVSMMLFDAQGQPVIGTFTAPRNEAGLAGAEIAEPTLNRGERYWLRVDGQENSRGTFLVNIDMPGRSSLPLTPGGFQDVFTNQFGDATVDSELNPAEEKDTYRLAFGSDGNATVRADRGSNTLDLEMGQWDELGQSVHRIDDDTNGLNPSLTIPVESQEDYFFSVGELNEDATGDYTFMVDGPTPSDVFDIFIGAGVNPPSALEFTDPDQAFFLRFEAAVSGDYQFNLGGPEGETVSGILFNDAGELVFGSHTEPLIADSSGIKLQDLVAGQTYVLRLDLAEDAIGILGTQVNAPNGLDFGILPESYGTLLDDDGPRHELILGGFLRLGDSVDFEPDGQPPTNGSPLVDDDDGVVKTATLLLNPDSATQSSVQVQASLPGKIDAWIDWDLNGSFEADERIFDSTDVIEGNNLLTIDVPTSDLISTDGFPTLPARFRFSSAGGLSPTGFASDGEVEDYFMGAQLVGVSSIAMLMTEPNLTIESVGLDLRGRTGGTTVFRGPIAGSNGTFVISDSTDSELVVNAPMADLSPALFWSGGAGFNTLRVESSGQTVDFASQAVIAAEGVSLIDIRGQGVNRLRIAESQIDDLTPESTTLQVMLDPVDRIEITDATFEVESVRVEDGQFLVRAASPTTAIDVAGMGWTNPVLPLDVSLTGGVDALDALLIVNELSNSSFIDPNTQELIPPVDLPESNPFPMRFFDTSGDGSLDAFDALLVINFIARNSNNSPPAPELIPVLPQSSAMTERADGDRRQAIDAVLSSLDLSAIISEADPSSTPAVLTRPMASQPGESLDDSATQASHPEATIAESSVTLLSDVEATSS